MKPDCTLGRRSREVLEALERELDQGLYAVGSTLPAERVLAERFGVSRPTIRRAVAVLEHRGRISTRHGSGMAVCAPATPGRSTTVSVMGIFDDERASLVQAWLLRRGFLPCTFSVTACRFDPQVERLFLEQVRRERHAALVAFCSPIPPLNTGLLADLALEGTRVVHVAPFRLAHPDQEFLLPDYEGAGRMAGERLRQAGCPACAFVRMAEAPYELLLERGFRKALPGAGVFVCPGNILSHPPAREQARAFLAGLPEGGGVFCRSRQLAADLLAVLRADLPARRLVPIAADDHDGTRTTDAPCDRLVFPSHQERIMRVLEQVVRPGQPPVRELLPAAWTPATPGAPPPG